MYQMRALFFTSPTGDGTAFSTWSSKTRAALRGSTHYPGGAFLVTPWPLGKYRVETCNPDRATSAQQVQGWRPCRRSVILWSSRLGLGTGLTTLACKGHMPRRPFAATTMVMRISVIEETPRNRSLNLEPDAL